MAGVYRVYPKPRKKSFLSGLSVTTILILVNIVLFIAFLILISSESIPIDYVALKPANIFSGIYLWTFLTSMFMHGGFFHIFANMFSLIFVGSLVERILGKKRYFWFYMVSGLFAGLLFVLMSLIFPNDYNAYAVGASGALFGLIGLLVLLTPNLSVFVMFIPIPIKLKYAGPGILILLWLISISADVGIGNTAHLGGLIAGLAYGIYLKKRFPNKTKALKRHFT